MTEEEQQDSEELALQSTSEESSENWKDKYLRLLAEQENMRKRFQKEKKEMVGFGIENAIAEFLPAIDNLDNALRFAQNAAPEIQSWALGFEMILSQFKEVLHTHGVIAFHSEGNTFDPDIHEAVEIVETQDFPEGTILQEFTKGYKGANRIVRPARVKVAKHPSKPHLSPACEEEETLTQN